MQAVVYRKNETSPEIQVQPTADQTAHSNDVAMQIASRASGPWSPEIFYPRVTAPEREIWTHWLPTSIVFERTPLLSPSLVLSTLTKLNAPPEVLEEFHWSWKTELFDAYEVRTPVRRDARDPLLLGRLGGQWYRVALWGESILPFEEISALVQQSLVIRNRASRWRFAFSTGGALIGLLLGWWMGTLAPEGSPLSMGLFFGMLGLFFAWVPTFLYTPENKQHDFLDRYRC